MTDKTAYGVWCEVSGGVTGHRQAWLKLDGNVQIFATLEEAAAEARRLETERASNTRACFRYHAMPL